MQDRLFFSFRAGYANLYANWVAKHAAEWA